MLWPRLSCRYAPVGRGAALGVTLLASATLARPARAWEASVAGSVSAEGRLFFAAPKYAGQSRDTGASLAAEPEASVRDDDSMHKLLARPFYRVDPIDEQRTHFDVREAYYRFARGSWEASAGAGIFSWGALESYRPTDVLNQIDFVEGATASAKLGQPFVEVGYVGATSSFKLYYLPFFRDRTFPGLRGRLRFPATIDVDHASYESSLGAWTPSGAARFATTLGDVDLGVAAFSGISRDPRFVVELTTGSVAPRYDLLQQGSVDAQWSSGGLSLKAEAFVRFWSAKMRAFGGGGLGADYTFSHVGGRGDLSLAVEAFFDTRPIDAPITLFRHDVFAGFRFALDDAASTEASGGAIVDFIDGTTFGKLEINRRFGEHWRATLAGNVFLAASQNIAASFARDQHAVARISYFF